MKHPKTCAADGLQQKGTEKQAIRTLSFYLLLELVSFDLPIKLYE